MGALTPLLQPLSIDEAVLDLAGTQALHGAPPAVVLARFARDGGTRGRRHRLDRPGRQPPARQDRGRTQQAARLRGDRRRRGRRAAGARTGAAAARHRPGAGAQAGGAGHHPAGPVAGAGRTATRMRRLGEDGPALVRRARGEDARPVDPDARNQVDQCRDDVRHRPDASRRRWSSISGGWRKSSAADCGRTNSPPPAWC